MRLYLDRENEKLNITDTWHIYHTYLQETCSKKDLMRTYVHSTMRYLHHIFMASERLSSFG